MSCATRRDPGEIAHFKSILSPDERKRADGFRKIRDTQRYVVTRGSLRSLLGAYLAIEPERLQFAYDPFGKPRLTRELSLTSLSFSVSHSGDWGLLGFVRWHKIGVDLDASARKLKSKIWRNAISPRMSLRDCGLYQWISGEKLFIVAGLARKLISRAGEKVFPTGWSVLKSVWLRASLRLS